MKRLGLILGTGLLLVACWTSTVSSRSIDVISESEASPNDELNAVNIPAVLEFEGGEGDSPDGVRDKRTPRIIFRTVSCLFTFLLNPNCLQGIMGGGGSGGSGGGLSSFGTNRRQQSSQQPYYMISLPRYNDTDNNGTATEYPIYPIESTSEYYPDEPSRPTNPIMAFIQWKMNLIPNMLRRFFPRLMGGRNDDGGSGGASPFAGLFSALRGGAGGGGGFGGLGQFGGGRLARLFGGGQGGEGGGFGGFGGLGGFGGGNQY